MALTVLGRRRRDDPRGSAGGGPDAGARAARARLEARGRRHGRAELCRRAPFRFEVTQSGREPQPITADQFEISPIAPPGCQGRKRRKGTSEALEVGSQSPPVTRGGAGLARREQLGSSEGRCRRYRLTSPRRRRAATPSITLGSATVRPVPRAPCVRRSRRLKISARPDPEPHLTDAPTSTPSRAAPMFQFTRYYRYGELDSCEGRWDAIWACMDSRKRSGQGLSSKAPVVADPKEERAKPYWNLMDPKVRSNTTPQMRVRCAQMPPRDIPPPRPACRRSRRWNPPVSNRRKPECAGGNGSGTRSRRRRSWPRGTGRRARTPNRPGSGSANGLGRSVSLARALS